MSNQQSVRVAYIGLKDTGESAFAAECGLPGKRWFPGDVVEVADRGLLARLRQHPDVFGFPDEGPLHRGGVPPRPTGDIASAAAAFMAFQQQQAQQFFQALGITAPPQLQALPVVQHPPVALLPADPDAPPPVITSDGPPADPALGADAMQIHPTQEEVDAANRGDAKAVIGAGGTIPAAGTWGVSGGPGGPDQTAPTSPAEPPPAPAPTAAPAPSPAPTPAPKAKSASNPSGKGKK